MSDHKCAGEIWQFARYFPCGKNGRHEHEGKWYCKLHHPPTRQAKQIASREKWQANYAAQKQASMEAKLAHDEMQRKADAYDGLVAEIEALKAERDAMVAALKWTLKNCTYSWRGKLHGNPCDCCATVIEIPAEHKAALDAARGEK